ncbi:MAG: hypothetical protein MUO59_00175 [Actinobacteria bacterium]|nr:hypothetical protein [Actinomycetota bacterium]
MRESSVETAMVIPIAIKGATEVLRLSTRQVKRIKKKVRLSGPEVIVMAIEKGRRQNAINEKVKDLVVELKTVKYRDTNMTQGMNSLLLGF